MPVQYRFRAFNPADGSVREGSITALDKSQVETYLGEQSLRPISIKEAPQRSHWWALGWRSLKSIEHLIFFTSSLSTLYRAGIPLLRALNIIAGDRPNSSLGIAVEQIRLQVQAGKSLSEAMAEYPELFSEVYIASVAAGEESGKLDQTLDEIAIMLERELELNRQIRAAVRYPIIVVSAIVAAMVVMFTFVIPRFVSFYGSFNASLPLPTRLLIGVGELFSNYWPYLLGALIAAGFGFRTLLQSPAGRLWWDRRLGRMPVIGEIIIKGNVARFSLMFRILFRSGLPIVKSLEVLGQTIRNSQVRLELDEMAAGFRRGKELLIPSDSRQYFPTQALQMLRIGLESGSLEQMLGEIGRHYSREVLYRSRQLTSVLEPILTVVVGAFVLLLALAIFLPMWSLIRVFHP